VKVYIISDQQISENNIIQLVICQQDEHFLETSNSNIGKWDSEKLNKCNLCNYGSLHTGNLRSHLKIHSGEKSYKRNQCDYASVDAGNLKRHMKTHSQVKNRTNAANAIMPLFEQTN